jgi:hypothetical protein
MKSAEHGLLVEFLDYLDASERLKLPTADWDGAVLDFLSQRDARRPQVPTYSIPALPVDPEAEDRVGEFVASRMREIHANARPARILRPQNPPSAPQRLWRVIKNASSQPGLASWFQAMECNGDGVVGMCRFEIGPPRQFHRDAEQDGINSGLLPWTDSGNAK